MFLFTFYCPLFAAFLNPLSNRAGVHVHVSTASVNIDFCTGPTRAINIDVNTSWTSIDLDASTRCRRRTAFATAWSRVASRHDAQDKDG